MLHADEIPVDLPLVRALIDRTMPALQALPLRRLASTGSSNALFRLGDGLLVRLPRQPGGTATITKEARWLPYVGPKLPSAVPEVVVVGEPGFGYPEHWSVVRWIEGDTPTPLPHNTSGAAPRHDLALDLAAIVAALRQVQVPEDALGDPALRWYRGGPLATMDEQVRDDLAACRTLSNFDLDFAAAERLWEEAMKLPSATPTGPQWLHADLAAENLLVRDGRLAAVLDFGGLSVGDPTVDLAVAWEVLDPAACDTFRSALGVDDATWMRGRAWALCLALMTFPYYWHTMPQRCAHRLTTAHAVLAG